MNIAGDGEVITCFFLDIAIFQNTSQHSTEKLDSYYCLPGIYRSNNASIFQRLEQNINLPPCIVCTYWPSTIIVENIPLHTKELEPYLPCLGTNDPDAKTTFCIIPVGLYNTQELFFAAASSRYMLLPAHLYKH